MDKSDFLAKAPLYYALAIAVSLQESPGRAQTFSEIEPSSLPEGYGFLRKRALFDRAIKLLADRGAIEIVPDDFGPILFKGSETLSDFMDTDGPREFLVFGKYNELGNKNWLFSALQKVNETYDELKITQEDFAEIETENEWQPIPLDRTDEKLLAANEALDSAIQEIERDNGYAVNVPAEREYVLSNLKAFSKLLKEQSEIYWMQIKTFGIDPLGRVIKRFGTAAVGMAAIAARDALIDWLKSAFANGLYWLGL